MTLAKIAEKQYPKSQYGMPESHHSIDEVIDRERAAFIAGDQRDRWISVEDDLPEDKAEVLICQAGNISTGWYDYETEKWCDAFVDGLMFVTHWQPLPSPPSNP